MRALLNVELRQCTCTAAQPTWLTNNWRHFVFKYNDKKAIYIVQDISQLWHGIFDGKGEVTQAVIEWHIRLNHSSLTQYTLHHSMTEEWYKRGHRKPFTG